MQRSSKPFGQALSELLEEQEVSFRELARRTRRHGDWGSQYTVSALIRGELKPTINAMEQISTALQIRPQFFAHYRLARARQQLDPDVVGLRKALRNLGE